MYVDGECICNLWGETPSTCTVPEGYDNNSIQMIFSAGKTIGAIMIAVMVDQGLLDYNEPVATYWPEFANNGKDKILLKDVLCHDAGLVELCERFNYQWSLTENIKKNMVGQVIENTPTRKFPHGITRKYHALCKDLITNEIFRRVEPQGRTMGEYFHQEIKDRYQIQVQICSTPEDNAITQNVKFASEEFNKMLMMEEDSFSTNYLPYMTSHGKEMMEKYAEASDLVPEEQKKVDMNPAYDGDAS